MKTSRFKEVEKLRKKGGKIIITLLLIHNKDEQYYDIFGVSASWVYITLKHLSVSPS